MTQVTFDKGAFETALQALADQYQVHITGKVIPISPEEDIFDISAKAVEA